MTSTTFKVVFIAAFLGLLACIVVGCAADQPSKTDAHPNRVPVAVGETVQAVPDPPQQPSPKEPDAAAPAPPKRESPFYGSTYWDELLTSVYFYPKDGDGEYDATHLKFSHREDDIWLCGDQRRAFKPGHRIKLTVTFEPNRGCQTNWQIE